MSITRPPDLNSFAELLPWRRPVDATRYQGRANATGCHGACRWTVAAYDVMDADDEAAAARGRRARRRERIRRWKLLAALGRCLRRRP